jgi:hypothetical protein
MDPDFVVLHKREYYQAAEGVWKVFPAHGDIRQAR